MHAFDRQTDRRTEISSQDRVCIPCSAVTITIGVVAYTNDNTYANNNTRNLRTPSILESWQQSNNSIWRINQSSAMSVRMSKNDQFNTACPSNDTICPSLLLSSSCRTPALCLQGRSHHNVHTGLVVMTHMLQYNTQQFNWTSTNSRPLFLFVIVASHFAPKIISDKSSKSIIGKLQLRNLVYILIYH